MKPSARVTLLDCRGGMITKVVLQRHLPLARLPSSFHHIHKSQIILGNTMFRLSLPPLLDHLPSCLSCVFILVMVELTHQRLCNSHQRERIS